MVQSFIVHPEEKNKNNPEISEQFSTNAKCRLHITEGVLMPLLLELTLTEAGEDIMKQLCYKGFNRIERKIIHLTHQNAT